MHASPRTNIFSAQPDHAWRTSVWWRPDSKAASAKSLISILALAHRESVPVASMVRHYASEQRMLTRWRMYRLAQLLEDGIPLERALEQVPNLLTEEQVLRIRFATENGILAETYEDLENPTGYFMEDSRIRTLQTAIYGVVVGGIALLVLSFLFVFIVPTFKEMFNEFGLRLPTVFLALMHFGDLAANVLPPALALLAILFVTLAWIIRPFRLFRRFVMSRLFQSVAKIRGAGVLHMLSQSLQHGRPIAAAISTLARYHYDQNLRSKLLFARNEVEQGMDTWQVLAVTKLLTPHEAKVIAQVGSGRLQGWLLEQVAERKFHRVENRLAVASMFVHPLFVLCFGALVAWVTVAFFSILVTMISSLA